MSPRQSGTNSMQNDRGEWVPSIPLPFYGRRKRCSCSCGRKFRSEQRYREHYAYEHIVMGRGERL